MHYQKNRREQTYICSRLNMLLFNNYNSIKQQINYLFVIHRTNKYIHSLLIPKE